MSQMVDYGSQYKPNIEASSPKARKIATRQKPTNISLEGRIGAAGQGAILRDQNSAGISEMPVQIKTSMPEAPKGGANKAVITFSGIAKAIPPKVAFIEANQERGIALLSERQQDSLVEYMGDAKTKLENIYGSAFQIMSVEHKEVCLQMSENHMETFIKMGSEHRNLYLAFRVHVRNAYLDFKASPAGLKATPEAVLSELAKSYPKFVFTVLNKIILTVENRTEILSNIAKAEPVFVLKYLNSVRLSDKNKVKILISMAVDDLFEVLEYLDNSSLSDENKTEVLSNIAKAEPVFVLEYFNGITLSPENKILLLSNILDNLVLGSISGENIEILSLLLEDLIKELPKNLIKDNKFLKLFNEAEENPRSCLRAIKKAFGDKNSVLSEGDMLVLLFRVSLTRSKNVLSFLDHKSCSLSEYNKLILSSGILSSISVVLSKLSSGSLSGDNKIKILTNMAGHNLKAVLIYFETSNLTDDNKIKILSNIVNANPYLVLTHLNDSNLTDDNKFHILADMADVEPALVLTYLNASNLSDKNKVQILINIAGYDLNAVLTHLSNINLQDENGSRLLIELAIGHPKLMLSYFNSPGLPGEEKAQLLSKLAKSHPKLVLRNLNNITLMPEEKALLLAELSKGHTELMLSYFNATGLLAEEKDRLLSELATSYPRIVLSNLNNIKLMPGERARLLKNAEASQERLEAFGTVFTGDRQGLAVSHGIERKTIDKAMRVAFTALQKGRLQRAIYNSRDGFIISPKKGSYFPEITFKAKELGSGTFGIASEVFLMSIGRIYAIKEAKTDVNEALVDVLNEASLLELLGDAEGLQKPPHEVVNVRSQEGTRRVGYIGRVYSGDMRAERPRTSAQRVEVARQLLSGLRTLHDKDIRHGDIKPGNIFMDTPQDLRRGKYKAYIADLGGARSFNDLRVIFEGYAGPSSGVMLSDIVGRLFGIYSKSYTKLNSQGYSLDMLAITKALREKDFNKYKSIERARDVYALGLSLLLTFACKDAQQQAGFIGSSKHIVSASLRFPRKTIKVLKGRGLSRSQIEILSKMVSPDWGNRPSVNEALQVFQ